MTKETFSESFRESESWLEIHLCTKKNVATFKVAPERLAVASALKNKSGAFLHNSGGTVDYFTPKCVGALYFL